MTLMTTDKNPETAVATSDRAAAASHNARINIPINVENWRHLPADDQDDLLWFHQHLIDIGKTMKESADTIGYDNSTLFRVLKGTYEGSWKNIMAAIRSYKKLAHERAGIQQTKFAPNSISRLIWSGLDYAVANNSMTLISGESGQGKTIAAEQWRDRNNHGRSVLVEIPPIGGSRSLIRVIAEAVGVNKSQPQDQMLEAILRAFNPNRILICDEARRLLPADTRGDVNPVKLEVIRYIHDRTGCAVGLIATQRFDDTLKKLKYQFEQVLGRVGQPVRLYREIKKDDVLPILQQYVSSPSDKLIEACMVIVNDDNGGRLRTLAQIFKVASRLASASKQAVSEQHVLKAIALRKAQMGEITVARK